MKKNEKLLSIRHKHLGLGTALYYDYDINLRCDLYLCDFPGKKQLLLMDCKDSGILSLLVQKKPHVVQEDFGEQLQLQFY